MCRKFPELIKAISNKVLTMGHFLRSWKRGVVLFFRKRNKFEMSRGYRLITLIPLLARILERLINQRIVEVLESAVYLDDAQHDFRKG